MIINLRRLADGLAGAPRPSTLVLGLALLAAGCASGSSSQPTTNMTPNASGMTPQELYNQYDTNNDNQITQDEWDAAYRSMDANGDGVVTQDEFHAAMGGGGGRR
jgi:spermidine/putrescine-binding protein